MLSWEVRGRQPARAQRGSQAAFQEAPARRRLLGGLLVARALHALRITDSRRATCRRRFKMASSLPPLLTTPQLLPCYSRLRLFR